MKIVTLTLFLLVNAHSYFVILEKCLDDKVGADLISTPKIELIEKLLIWTPVELDRKDMVNLDFNKGEFLAIKNFGKKIRFLIEKRDDGFIYLHQYMHENASILVYKTQMTVNEFEHLESSLNFSKPLKNLSPM